MRPLAFQGWTISLDGASADIGFRGGLVVGWNVPRDGHLVPLLDGYRDLEERLSNDGSRQSVLAPWTEPLRDFRYTWRGRTYDLDAGRTEGTERQNGLLELTGFELVEQTDSTVTVSKTISSDAYPVPLRVRMTYALAHRTDPDGKDVWSLTLDASATNLGDVPAPIAFGWNPHVLWHGDPARATVEIAASSRIATDRDRLPLAGDAAFTDIGSGPHLMGVDPETESSFTGLQTETDGILRARIRHGSGARTTLEARPGGTLPGHDTIRVSGGASQRYRPGRAAVVGYSQFMADAYNRPELHDALSVDPGESRRMATSMTHRF